MKLHQLTEVRYSQPLEAEPILYALWERREQIQPTKLRVERIENPTLSAKRATAIVRYTVRVIVPEALDAFGMTDEAQKLRNLPPDVDLYHARVAARGASAAAGDAGFPANIAAVIASAANTAVRSAAIITASNSASADAAYDAVYAVNTAAAYASEVTNKQRHLYHLDKMIQICLKIK